MTRALLLPAALGLLAVFLPGATADVLTPRSGKAVQGVVVSETEEEVVFNPYWSRNPGMVYEVLRLPRAKVKKVEIAPRPIPEVFRRLRARTPGDTAALLGIARFAADHKLRAHEEMCLALALAEDPTNAEALKAVGGSPRWEAMRRGNPWLDPQCLAALRRYVAEPDPKAREGIQRELEALGFPARDHELERHRRSAHMPRGYLPRRPVSVRADVHVGATYALFVPDAYDPAVPWPLLIGLHGGGPDGKALDEVVGSGPSAMNFYRDMAAQRGFLVACPTALVATWSQPVNEALVRDVILEMKLTYNVDVDRVYLTGHSMGGYGTWALGPKMAPDLAAISPMAGQGGSGIQALVENRTAIFIYHSDDDYIDVSTDRNAARQLAGTDLDFVYTELPGQGHGYPESIRVELFDFLEPRRRHDRTYKEAWPRSSFFGKVTKDEITYVGDPLEERQVAPPGVDVWVQRLRLGGGRAEVAVARLAETRPPGAADAVSKVFKDPKASLDARAYAARALGLLGDPLENPSLRKAVAAEAVRNQSRVAVEAARALVALKDAEAGPSLAKAIEAWTKYYEGKVMGDAVRISDWERALTTLAEIVAAWDALAADADVGLLVRTVVKRVFAPQHRVETSDRVPQDPSEARTALATAVADAFAKHGATSADWDALEASLANDAKAQAAARRR